MQKNSHTPKALRRIDAEIIRRIIVILYEDGKQKKTKMALKAHISYDKCIRYLNWLDLMDLIRKEEEHNSEYINLTENGANLYKKYSQYRSSKL